ncbi:MAG: hypothetical protein DRP90_05265 [Planctomycetota bacterium]|nr:MAG: hypothetical protein DRP90_05265 [Planctomycetota bacterium]
MSRDTARMLDDYRMMLLIRRFEERVERLFAEGLIHGTTHLCIGQEAVPVGISALLDRHDLTVSNHRGHGHFLARGADPSRLMAELLGRVTGYCKGKGGTQHLSGLEVGHLGSNGITAGGLPVAAGAAFSLKRLRPGSVAVAYFGDGAMGEGVWHETMNIASLWKLPLLFVCENNLYAMSTPVKRGISGKSLAVRAAAYDMQWTVADGNDVEAVRAAAADLLEDVRAGRGPAFLEAQTYRFRGHSKSDAREYRTREEEEKWLAKCPIRRQEAKLAAAGVGEDELERVRREVEERIEEAARFALDSDWPPVDEALRDLYA